MWMLLLGRLIEFDSINHYYNMGQLCCIAPLGEQYLTRILQKALLKSQIKIDQTTQFTKINRLIQDKIATNQLQLEHCIVVYQIKQGGNQRLVIKERNEQAKGIIVFHDKYYIGKLKDNQANDKNGQMHVIQSLQDQTELQKTKLIIKGKWDNDTFQQGKVNNNLGQTIFCASWNQLSSTFHLKFQTGQIKEYIGEANFVAVSVPQVLTSSFAKLIFRDGSVYNGPVQNGIMHTENSEEGEFISADRTLRFKGKYVNGQKHGNSQMQLRQDGLILKFTLKWQNGVPDYDSLSSLDRASLQSFLRVSRNNESILSSRGNSSLRRV